MSVEVPKHTENAPDMAQNDWCNHVFGSFLSVYETQWEHQYGSFPTGKFLDFAQLIDDQDLNRILQHCHERIQLGNSWPPQMGELWVLKDALTSQELLDSRIRVMARQPNNEIETWLVQNKRYQLQRTAERELDTQFKKYYIEAQRLKERGMLVTKPPQAALGSHSVKNLNDLKREEYLAQHGRQLHPKIAAILAKKPR